MDRIDILENEILKLQKLTCLANSESIDISKLGNAQNLKDREIIEFLGDDYYDLIFVIRVSFWLN